MITIAERKAKELSLTREVAYLRVLADQVKRLATEPDNDVPNNEEDIRQIIDASINFINKVGNSFIPDLISAGIKLRAANYNNVVDAIWIDLKVLYDQLSNMESEVANLSRQYSALYESSLIKIDTLLSKIRNLRDLENSWDEVDDAHYDTFVIDSNTYPDQFLSAVNDDRAGLIRLNTVNTDDIVSTEYNYDLIVSPMSDNTALKTYGEGPTGFAPHQHHESVITSLFPVYTNSDMGTTNVSYPGAVMGVILNLPARKTMNHLSFSHVSAGNIEVLGVYYSDKVVTSSRSPEWQSIEIETDVFNTRSFDFSLLDSDQNPIEARSLMVLIGQPVGVIRNISRNEALLIDDEESLSSIFAKLGKVSNRNSDDLIKYYMNQSVALKIDTFTRSVINELIGFLESNIRPNNKAEGDEKDEYFQAYEYTFTIYGLKVEYRRYNNASVYLSQYFNDDGSVLAAQLSATGNIMSGTAVKHYLDIDGNKRRILSADETSIVDTYTVEDREEREISTDIMIDTSQSITVKKNNIEIPLSAVNGYTLNKLYTGADIAYSINISSGITLNVGDLITIEYTPSQYNSMLERYNPYLIKISDIVGRPTLRYSNLTTNSISRILTINSNSTYTTYETSLGNREVDPVIADELNGDEVLDSTQNIAYAFYTPVKDPNGVFPTYTSQLLNGNGVKVVKEESVIKSSKTIYKGIINEQIVMNGSSALNTAHAYIPGTLHVEVEDTPLIVTEYATDTLSVKNDKTEFTLGQDYSNRWPSLDKTLSVSYIPIDSNTSGQIINLAAPNKSEIFFATAADNTLKLTFTPWNDIVILYEASSLLGNWIAGDGAYIYKMDNSVIYEPIVVYVGKRKAINRTEYLSKEKPKLNEYNERFQNFEYYVEGNKVIFNTSISEQIRVQYYAIDRKFRLRSDLIRLDKANDAISPEIYDYAVFMNRK